MPIRSIEYIFVKSELGAGTYGSSLGVEAIWLVANQRNSDLFERYPQHWIEDDSVDVDEPPYAHNIHNIVPLYNTIARSVQHSRRHNHIPVVIAGDHANAGGTLAGLRMAHPDKRIGVIWIDAHGDLNTPWTTPSGNMHGMPLGASLGLHATGPDSTESSGNPVDAKTKHAWQLLCEIGGIYPKVQVQDLVLVGIRDLDEPEWEFVRKHNICHFTPEDITVKGAATIAEETLAHLADCDYIYVSFDIDSLDETIVPGTGTPTPGGLSIVQAQELLWQFWSAEKMIALEFCEINPLLDNRNQTAQVAFELLSGLLDD